jgi:hypothetical protein
MPDFLARTGNITQGLVAALSAGEDTGRFQLSAQIQPGNSGGPVLDQSGNVIGVVVSGLSAAYFLKANECIPQDVNFAIKAPAVLNFLHANGIEPSATSSAQPQSWSDVAEFAKPFTVLIECNVPVAAATPGAQHDEQFGRQEVRFDSDQLTKGAPMKLTEVLKQWLEEVEWDDELKLMGDIASQLETTVEMEGHSIEGDLPAF